MLGTHLVRGGQVWGACIVSVGGAEDVGELRRGKGGG